MILHKRLCKNQGESGINIGVGRRGGNQG